MNETDLGSLLDRMSSALPDVGPSIPELISGGRRIRRRRRGLLAMGLTAVATVVAATLLTLPTVTHASLLPAGQPPPAGSPTDQQLWDWVEQLPVGPPAHVSYGYQNHVWSEGRVITYPTGLEIQLEAPLRGGWLARVDHPIGGGHDIRPAFVGVDGSIRYFTDHREHRHGVVTGEAASPDGTEVIYKGFVVDVATGAVVDRVPYSAYAVVAWTDQGVEYLGRRSVGRGVFLWRPGASPVRLVGDEIYAPDLVVKYGATCQEGRLVEHGSAVRLTDACGSFSYSMLPTSRDFVVMSDGRLVGRDGRVAARFPVPEHAPQPPGIFLPHGASCCGLQWEDDTHLLVTMDDYPARPSPSPLGRPLLVRCAVEGDDLDCRRAPAGSLDIFRIAIRPPLS